MELNQLNCFRELAKRQHLTKTAQYLNYSAPSLSTMISRLEAELGVSLFDRVGRNIRLNKNGKLFLEYVEQALDALDNGVKKLADTQKNSVVYVGSSAQTLWLPLFNEFFTSYPDIFVSRTTLRLEQMAEDKELERFDFLLTAESDVTAPGWDRSLLCENTPPLLLISRNHRLSGARSVRLQDIADETFIVMQKGTSMRIYFEAMCQADHVSVPNVLECDVILRSELMKKESNCVSVTTAFAINSPIYQGIEMIPLETAAPARNFALFWPRSRKMSVPATLFKDFVRSYYERMRP